MSLMVGLFIQVLSLTVIKLLARLTRPDLSVKTLLSGRMFNSEDELGLAIESALHSRYDSNGFDASYSQFSYA
jgi:hypothetical protein